MVFLTLAGEYTAEIVNFRLHGTLLLHSLGLGMGARGTLTSEILSEDMVARLELGKLSVQESVDVFKARVLVRHGRKSGLESVDGLSGGVTELALETLDGLALPPFRRRNGALAVADGLTDRVALAALVVFLQGTRGQLGGTGLGDVRVVQPVKQWALGWGVHVPVRRVVGTFGLGRGFEGAARAGCGGRGDWVTGARCRCKRWGRSRLECPAG